MTTMLQEPDEPMPTCFLHVGQHKTGTTAIQAFLADNRALLARHGVLVPLKGTRNLHDELVRDMLGMKLPPGAQGQFDRLKADLARQPGNDVVLSAERLETALLRDPSVIAFFRDAGYDVRLVLYLRHQPQSLNSRYAQRVKTFRLADDFLTMVEQDRRLGYFRYTNWLDLARANNCRLLARPYDARVRSGGVVQDFLRAIGRAEDDLMAAISSRRSNESLGPCGVAVARAVLARVEGGVAAVPHDRSHACRLILRRAIERQKLREPAFSGLDTALARRLEREFGADNDRFARAVWRAEWGDVFAGDVGRAHEVNDFAQVGMSDGEREQFDRLFEQVWGESQRVLREGARPRDRVHPIRRFGRAVAHIFRSRRNGRAADRGRRFPP